MRESPKPLLERHLWIRAMWMGLIVRIALVGIVGPSITLAYGAKSRSSGNKRSTLGASNTLPKPSPSNHTLTKPGPAGTKLPEIKVVERRVKTIVDAMRKIARRCLHPTLGSASWPKNIEVCLDGVNPKLVPVEVKLWNEGSNRVARLSVALPNGEAISTTYAYPIPPEVTSDLLNENQDVASSMLAAIDVRLVCIAGRFVETSPSGGPPQVRTAVRVRDRHPDNVLDYVTHAVDVAWPQGRAELTFRDPTIRGSFHSEAWDTSRRFVVRLADGVLVDGVLAEQPALTPTQTQDHPPKLTRAATQALRHFDSGPAIAEIERSVIRPGSPTTLEQAVANILEQPAPQGAGDIYNPRINQTKESPSKKEVDAASPPTAPPLDLKEVIQQLEPDPQVAQRTNLLKKAARDAGDQPSSCVVPARGSETDEQVVIVSRPLHGRTGRRRLGHRVDLITSPEANGCAVAAIYASTFSQKELNEFSRKNSKVTQTLAPFTDPQMLAHIGRTQEYTLRFADGTSTTVNTLPVDSRNRLIDPRTDKPFGAREESLVKASLERRVKCTVRVRVPKHTGEKLDFYQHGVTADVVFHGDGTAEILISDRNQSKYQRGVVPEDRSLPKVHVVMDANTGWAEGQVLSADGSSPGDSSNIPFFFKLSRKLRRSLKSTNANPIELLKALEEQGFLNIPSLFRTATKRYIGEAIDLPDDLGLQPVKLPWAR